MAEWRFGGKLKRTLYRDEVFVGLVDTAEIAAEIVETMNRVGRLLDEVRAADPSACRFCGHSPEDHAGSVGGGAMACALCPLGLCEEPRPRDAQRRSEATPQKDLLHSYCRRVNEVHDAHWHAGHSRYCPGILAEHLAFDGSRVDPYDSTKGGVAP